MHEMPFWMIFMISDLTCYFSYQDVIFLLIYLKRTRSFLQNSSISGQNLLVHRQVNCRILLSRTYNCTTLATWTIDFAAHADSRRSAPALQSPAHTSQVAMAAQTDCGFEILPHGPYSPDLDLFPKGKHVAW
jgi:hypothetical protein